MDSLPILAATAGAFLLAGFVKGVIGLGLPTVAIGLLGLLMTPAQAAAILVVPSLVTNIWQFVVGGDLLALVRRMWPMLAGICIGTFIGAALLPSGNSGQATVWLGLALAFYAGLGLIRIQVSVPPRAEIWLGLLMGTATGAITVATGIFVLPGTPYVQALQFERDRLVQALGLSFTVSTITLAAALAMPAKCMPAWPARRWWRSAPRSSAWCSGNCCAAGFGRRRSGCASSSACCCSARIWRCAGCYDRLNERSHCFYQDHVMKIVDLSHVMNVHTPGWVGYAGNKMYYAQNLQTQMIVAQRIDTALHVGTHFDGAMHATDNRKGDMASLPLDYLVNRGVVVDISKHMHDWAVITPEMIESAGADIREDDILILHTGWHKHYEGQPQQDLVKYFCYHPGPNLDTLHWMLKKKIRWWGMDCGSCDHAMNTSIRRMRPDLADEFTKKHGKTPAEFFGTFEYTHKKSGRRVSQDMFPFHSWAFQEGLLHAENLGGDIELMLGKRSLIGAFPWRYEGLEGCPCRVVCFLDTDMSVEAVGDAAKAIMRSA